MTMKKAIAIPKGAAFTVTSGIYSDYFVQGVFRALVEIDAEALRDQWIKDHPEQAADYRFREGDFLASISSMMEPIECWELHLGNYSRASELFVDKPA